MNDLLTEITLETGKLKERGRLIKYVGGQLFKIAAEVLMLKIASEVLQTQDLGKLQILGIKRDMLVEFMKEITNESL